MTREMIGNYLASRVRAVAKMILRAKLVETVPFADQWTRSVARQVRILALDPNSAVATDHGLR